MATLQEAQGIYETVPDEFPTEFRAANVGSANVAMRLRELKGELTQNAQALSGLGFLPDMQRLAASSAGGMDEQGLRTILNNQINAQINKLKTDYQGKFAVAPTASKP